MLVGTLAEVAEHFSVTLQVVYGWRREGMPGARGMWDLAAIDEWRVQQSIVSESQEEIDSSVAASVGMGRSENLERVRYWTARKHELDYAARRGELVERDEVKRVWAERVIAMRGAMLRLSRALGAQLEGLDAAGRMDLIDKLVREMLIEFASGHVGILDEEERQMVNALLSWEPQ